MLNKIINKWENFSLMDFLYDFKYGFNNLIKWFHVIWRDRDYDWYFILHILQFKLKKQSKYIRKNNIHENSINYSEIMMECVDLIEKIKTEYYLTEYMDYEESKIEFIDIPENERGNWYRDGMKQMKVTQIRENLDEYMNKYKEIHDFVISNQDKCVFKNDTKKHISMNIGMELHKRSRKKLFDTLEQHIENFWD